MKEIMLIIILLSLIQLVVAEKVTNSGYEIVSIPYSFDEIDNTEYEVLALVTDFADVIINSGNEICIGFHCQLIKAMIEEEEEPVTPGGGGGRLYEEQGNITYEEFNTSLILCVEAGGVPVNIKGGIFCKINDTYTPIEKMLGAKIEVFGIAIPDIGAMISKDNPAMGWIILIMISTATVLFIIDRKRAAYERKVKRTKRDNNLEKENMGE